MNKYFIICFILFMNSVLLLASTEKKNQITGFVLRGLPSEKAINNPGKRSRFIPPVKGVDATIVFAEWQHIQPQKFGALAPNNIIDQALVAVEKWNRQNPKDKVRIRLRTLAGIHSPKWVMDYAGSNKIDFTRLGAKHKRIFELPNFWTPKFFEAWKDFQTKLAARYDKHPLIADVSISGMMSLHTEVMWRQQGKAFPNALKDMAKAGLKADDELKNFQKDITLFMETWKQTPVEMTFNSPSYFEIADGELQMGRKRTELIVDVLNYLKSESQRLKKPYMIGNHSLSEWSVLENEKWRDKKHVLYHLKKARENGAVLYFQTEVFTADKAHELLHEGLNLGASLIELSNDMTSKKILEPEIQKLRQKLKKNLPH